MTGKATVKRGPRSRGPKRRPQEGTAAAEPWAGDPRLVQVLRAQWMQRDAGTARHERDRRKPV